MHLRAHREAYQIKDIFETVTPVLVKGVEALGIVIATLEETKVFGGEMRADLAETIAEAKDLHHRISVRLEQLLTDLDVITRAIEESSGLTKQTKDEIDVAAGKLVESGEIAVDHLERLANAATVVTGLEYLYSDPVYLERILNIAKPEVTARILEGMGWVVQTPGEEVEPE